MYESSKCAPQEALRALDKAFEAFFRRVKAGETPGYPRFKKRSRAVGGFHLSAATHASDHSLKLPKIGWVRVKPWERNYIPEGTYKAVSVKEHAGRWYASVSVEDGQPQPQPNGFSAVGVDLGVAQLATVVDETGAESAFENPRALRRYERRLRNAQKTVSRRKRGSGRRQKANARASRIHRRISNIRANAIHQATTYLAKNHGAVVVEDLKVANMTRRAKGRGRAAKAGLNKSILDAGFHEFRRQLEYKCPRYGSALVIVNAAYTSQRCSACNHTEPGNRISQAVFCCLACGRTENADVNAARNILVAGSCPETQNARGADVRPTRRKSRRQIAKKRESA
jgi:putative transposase